VRSVAQYIDVDIASNRTIVPAFPVRGTDGVVEVRASTRRPMVGMWSEVELSLLMLMRRPRKTMKQYSADNFAYVPHTTESSDQAGLPLLLRSSVPVHRSVASCHGAYCVVEQVGFVHGQFESQHENVEGRRQYD
jgi:hypothetical protein